MSHFLGGNPKIKGDPEDELKVHAEEKGHGGHHPKSGNQKQNLIHKGHNTERCGLVQETVVLRQTGIGKLPREQEKNCEGGCFKDGAQNRNCDEQSVAGSAVFQGIVAPVKYTEIDSVNRGQESGGAFPEERKYDGARTSNDGSQTDGHVLEDRSSWLTIRMQCQEQ